MLQGTERKINTNAAFKFNIQDEYLCSVFSPHVLARRVQKAKLTHPPVRPHADFLHLNLPINSEAYCKQKTKTGHPIM